MECFLPFSAQVLQVRVCLTVIGREISSKMEMVFHFGSHDSSFWRSNMCQHCQTTIFLALGLQKNCLNCGSTLCIEDIRKNCFIFFPGMGMDLPLFRTMPSRTTDIPNIISNWFSSLFKISILLVTLQEKRTCLFFKGFISHLTRKFPLYFKRWLILLLLKLLQMKNSYSWFKLI